MVHHELVVIDDGVVGVGSGVLKLLAKLKIGGKIINVQCLFSVFLKKIDGCGIFFVKKLANFFVTFIFRK